MPGRCCPYCGSTLPIIRLGVRLTEGKARIFDLVMRGGRDGIASRDLQDITGLSWTCLKSHMYQINELIEDEGYRIVGDKGRGANYRLVNKREAGRLMPR